MEEWGLEVLMDLVQIWAAILVWVQEVPETWALVDQTAWDLEATWDLEALTTWEEIWDLEGLVALVPVDLEEWAPVALA